MRKTIQDRMAARLENACNLQEHRIPTLPVGRVLTAIGACLFACLLLHVDISAPVSSAYASTWPVGSSQGGVCLAFGEAYTFDSSTYTHKGIDVPAVAGAEVRAPLGGVVTFVGRVPSGDSIKGGIDKGKTMTAVSIELDDGKTVTLMPLDSTAAKKGQRITEGDEVGTLAATGDRSYDSPHLHMGLKNGRIYCDPLSLFGEASTQTTQDETSATVPLSAKRAGQVQDLVPNIAEAAPKRASQRAENPLFDAGVEPSFGVISSKAAESELGSSEPTAGETTSPPALLAVLGTACSAQLDSLLTGYSEFGEKLHLPVCFLLFASALLGVIIAAAVIGGIIILIRRNAAHKQVHENSSLHAKRGGASIYGLFPAPGTSFITRGRLAQRR